MTHHLQVCAALWLSLVRSCSISMNLLLDHVPLMTHWSAGLRCFVAIAGVELLQLLPVLGELEALEQAGAPPGMHF